MNERLNNLIWKTGIRAFRLTRALNLSVHLEPAFVRLAGLVPSSKQPTIAQLPGGQTLLMPAGYRDARTVSVGLFQQGETRLFNQIVQSGMAFVDVGAYVGYFTMLAARLVGDSGHVFAFEPDGLAFEYLGRNVVANSRRNVTCVNEAASDRVSTATLVRDPAGPESFLSTDSGVRQSAIVHTVSLDSFFESLSWPRVDVVKMNIEGSELTALRGMKELSRRNPDLQLVMEVNPGAMRRAAVTRTDLADTLKELGFRKGQVVERGLKVVGNGQLIPDGGAVYNVFLTK